MIVHDNLYITHSCILCIIVHILYPNFIRFLFYSNPTERIAPTYVCILFMFGLLDTVEEAY